VARRPDPAQEAAVEQEPIRWWRLDEQAVGHRPLVDRRRDEAPGPYEPLSWRNKSLTTNQ
jgi:hypothetical protein